MKAKEKNILLVLFALITFGLIQVYSSSYIFAIEKFDDGLLFFKKQLFFSVTGFAMIVAVMKIPYEWIRKWGWVLWALAFFGIILTFIPGLGVKVNGAQRWFHLPFGLRFEPCELLKISLPLLLAKFATQYSNEWGKWTTPIRAAIVLIPMATLLLQPDFGSFMLTFMVLATLLFAFGLPWKYIFATTVVALPTFYFLVMNVPYRKARVLAFLDPWQNPDTSGFQLIQSLLSFHAGGLTGVGLGDGQGKLFFLPEAHTDFTLAVFGEEMGYIGFVILLLAYGYLVFRGFQLAFSIKQREKQIMALGLTLTFAYSVFVNVGVTLGLLPTKGLTLPFLSSGGSSLWINCLLFGILLNLFRNRTKSGRRRARVAR